MLQKIAKQELRGCVEGIKMDAGVEISTKGTRCSVLKPSCVSQSTRWPRSRLRPSNAMSGTVGGWPKDEPVLLQVMKIPNCGVRRGNEYETVLWDSACTGRFVRKEHARQMGFPFQKQRLRVCTLGGDIREIDGEL